MSKERMDLEAMYKAAIEAVNPVIAVKDHLRTENGKLLVFSDGKLDKEYNLSDFRNIIVVGAGKATAAMARAVEDLLGDRITAGCISVKYGYTEKLTRIETIEAAHPIPDENGVKASLETLSLLENANEKDLVISLISGGGSALLPLPPGSISLEQKRNTTSLLLKCGATIHEINSVRKHLSLVKGGNLARKAYPATVLSLMISDVVGDDLDVIASGPFVPDSSTFEFAYNTLVKYGIINDVPDPVKNHLEAGKKGSLDETPKSGSEVFNRVYGLIIASNIIALKAVQKVALEKNYNTIILSSLIEGETKDIARMHTAIAQEIRLTGNPVKPPACVISGGETTVTVAGDGLGGRNMEFAIQAAKLLDNESGISVVSVGTDGTDGPTDAAGAFADGNTVRIARDKGLDISDYIQRSDSYNFFKKTGDLIITGPTNTNVMDVRIIIVGK